MSHAAPNQILSIFEILGAYFTDTLFNHVYISSKTRVTSSTSLTDEYVRQVQAYMVGVKNDKRCYCEVLQGVHKYFAIQTRYTAQTFGEFVDKIVRVCVPDEYYAKLSSGDKDELLGTIICDLISNMSAYVTSPEILRRIIDEHTTSPSVTIRMIQDLSIKSLTTKRAAIFNMFLRKAGQARAVEAPEVVDRLKDAIRQLAAELKEQEAKNKALQSEVKILKDREDKFRNVIKLMRAEASRQPSRPAPPPVLAPIRPTVAVEPVRPAPEPVRFAVEPVRPAPVISSSFFRTEPLISKALDTKPQLAEPKRQEPETHSEEPAKAPVERRQRTVYDLIDNIASVSEGDSESD